MTSALDTLELIAALVDKAMQGATTHGVFAYQFANLLRTEARDLRAREGTQAPAGEGDGQAGRGKSAARTPQDGGPSPHPFSEGGLGSGFCLMCGRKFNDPIHSSAQAAGSAAGESPVNIGDQRIAEPFGKAPDASSHPSESLSTRAAPNSSTPAGTRLVQSSHGTLVPERRLKHGGNAFTEEERDAMSSAFKRAEEKHGHYETLFAVVCAWLDVVADRYIESPKLSPTPPSTPSPGNLGAPGPSLSQPSADPLDRLRKFTGMTGEELMDDPIACEPASTSSPAPQDGGAIIREAESWARILDDVVALGGDGSTITLEGCAQLRDFCKAVAAWNRRAASPVPAEGPKLDDEELQHLVSAASRPSARDWDMLVPASKIRRLTAEVGRLTRAWLEAAEGWAKAGIRADQASAALSAMTTERNELRRDWALCTEKTDEANQQRHRAEAAEAEVARLKSAMTNDKTGEVGWIGLRDYAVALARAQKVVEAARFAKDQSLDLSEALDESDAGALTSTGSTGGRT